MQASALVHLEGCQIESSRVQTERKASLRARFSVTDKLHRVVISHALLQRAKQTVDNLPHF